MCTGNFVLCKENNINLPGITLVSSSYEPFFVRFKISEIWVGLLFMASINWSHILNCTREVLMSINSHLWERKYKSIKKIFSSYSLCYIYRRVCQCRKQQMGARWLKIPVLVHANTLQLKQIFRPSFLNQCLFLHLQDCLKISSRKGNLAVCVVGIIVQSIVSVQERVLLKFSW
jgi:hypothetical protein